MMIGDSVWFDGQMMASGDARIHFLSHSLQYGSAVFEGIRCYNSKPFRLEEHVCRLFESAAILGYTLPFSEETIASACREVQQSSGVPDTYLRPTAWRGDDRFGISGRGARVHVAIASWSWPSQASVALMSGLRLTMSEWRRPAPQTAPVHAKASGLYQICSMAKQEAEAANYDDALMLDYRGFLAEATGANLFLVIDDALHTPLADCFLNGITRQTVISIARSKGIAVVERYIAPEELGRACEVFLTGTALEIAPVSKINSYDFVPGAMCSLIIEEYRRLTQFASDAL